MNLNEIFSSNERIKILEEVLVSERIRVGELSKKLKISKGLLSKYLEILVKEKILSRKGNEFSLQDNLNVKGIKILMTLRRFEGVFSKYKFVVAAGLYGSGAKGTNQRESDFDIWVKIRKASNEEKAKLGSEIRKKVENVSILFLDEAKIEDLKKNDKVFYSSLFFGSIVIYGGENEI